MDASNSIPELVANAQANVIASPDRIGAEAIDIFSLFEARMQHHFKRGPFSRKLKALLLKAGQGDLAQRVHLYYLAINVLKHGKGASHRELIAMADDLPDTLIVLTPPKGVDADEDSEAVALIDLTAPGFFDGLSQTILDAYAFLENK